MYSLNFLKYSSPDEIRLLKAVHYLLSKDVVWDILVLLIKDDGLTQNEMIGRLSRKNISDDINCMVLVGLLTESYGKPNNHCCREKVYYINDHNIKTATNTYEMHYKKRFEDSEVANYILKKCRKNKPF